MGTDELSGVCVWGGGGDEEKREFSFWGGGLEILCLPLASNLNQYIAASLICTPHLPLVSRVRLTPPELVSGSESGM